MLNYIVAIPSSHRSEILKKRTLTFLRNNNIDNFKIFIFVAKEEIETYRTALSDKQYKNINIIEGLKGCANNRMAISRYFDEETPIVSLDDDITNIIDITGSPIKSLHYLVSDSINFMMSNNIKLMGIQSTNNTFFMKNHISSDLKFIAGCFRIFFNKKYCENRQYNLLEDYEVTLNYYKYSGTARWENYGLIVDYDKLPGGIKEQRSNDKKREEVKRFLEQYPNYCRVKKDGMEIQLIKNPIKNKVFSLWIGTELPQIQILALQSWLRQNYEVTLYTQLDKLPIQFQSYINSKQIILKNYNDILHYDDSSEILPYADEFRFKCLYENGGTYLDMDIVLLKELPNDKIVISSERTFVKGRFKSKQRFTPNIGVLRFNKGNEFLKEVLEKINKYKSVDTATWKDNMTMFKGVLKKKKWEDYYKFVCDPEEFCPLHYWNWKEAYEDKNIYSEKYGVVDSYTRDQILNNSIGVHLNNRFTTGNKFNLDSAHIFSLYGRLVSMIMY